MTDTREARLYTHGLLEEKSTVAGRAMPRRESPQGDGVVRFSGCDGAAFLARQRLVGDGGHVRH